MRVINNLYIACEHTTFLGKNCSNIAIHTVERKTRVKNGLSPKGKQWYRSKIVRLDVCNGHTYEEDKVIRTIGIGEHPNPKYVRTVFKAVSVVLDKMGVK
jgi:hypothetical protein